MTTLQHNKPSAAPVEVTSKSQRAARFSRAKRFDSDMAATLWRLTVDLLEPQNIDKAIFSLLADGGRANGTQLAVVLRRRKHDVLRTCRELAAAGKLRRVRRKWERTDLYDTDDQKKFASCWNAHSNGPTSMTT